MNTYWLTFRLADTGRYTERLTRLTDLIRQQGDRSAWQEPTSFILFWSKLNIDAMARQLKTVIDPAEDVVLLGSADLKAARLIGVPKDHLIYALLPHVKDA